MFLFGHYFFVEDYQNVCAVIVNVQYGPMHCTHHRLETHQVWARVYKWESYKLQFTAVNFDLARSAAASPRYGLSSPALSNLNIVSPSRVSEMITWVHSSLIILSFPPFLHLFQFLPICLLSLRPLGCSLSKPIVSMHIVNKLCSSKGYKAPFCSVTHCHSIISCYHDMPPLKPSILGGKMAAQRAQVILNSVKRA